MKFWFLAYKSTIFKRIFHKHDSPTSSLKYTIKAKRNRKQLLQHVIVKNPPQVGGIDNLEKVTPEPALTAYKGRSSCLNSNSNQLSNNLGGAPQEIENEEEKKISEKNTDETSAERVDCAPEVISFDTDYGNLFEETRLACVNVENVEGNKLEFFSGDDALSSLVAESNDNYEDTEKIRKIATNREKLKQSTKQIQNAGVRYNYDCFRCGKKFKNRAPLNLHIASEHNEDGGLGLLCIDCGKQVDYDHELKLHKKFFCKKVKKSFQCLDCLLYFVTETEKNEHPCTKDPSKPYYCTVKDCQTISRNVKDLTEHVTRHLGIKPFLCNVCGKAFSAKKDMDRHGDVHKESKDYICKECGNSFKSYHTMRRHVFSHNFKDRFKCDKCSYTTAMKNCFDQHMIRHKKREHTCKICAKKLRSARSLSKHIQNRHTFNRIFTCRFCDFTTDVGLSYSSHMRNHKGRKHHARNLAKKTSKQNMALDLSDTAKTGHDFQVATSENVLNASQLHSSFSFTNMSPNVKYLVNTPLTSTPMLGDAAILDHEDLNISSQNADSVMADPSDLSVISSDGANTSLFFYTIGLPSSTLNVPNFISDTITAVSVPENWPGSEVN